jgi:outer membrane protein assembly factor BamB
MKDVTRVISKRIKKSLGNQTVRALALAMLFIISGIGASLLINPAAAAPNASPAAAASPSSSSSAAAAAAAPAALTQAEANWGYPNGNEFAQDYNPQTQINASNAQYLGLNWLFPLPSLPPSLASFSGRGGTGVDTAVLIINGTVYAITQFDEAFALNAADGDVEWSYQVPLSLNSTIGTGSPLALHTHDGNEQWTTSLFGHTPALWFLAEDNQVYALDALNGTVLLNFTTFTGPQGLGLKGNSPTSTYEQAGEPNILVDQSQGILITSHGNELYANGGRCYYDAWNILANPPTPLWTTYCTPPQPNSDVPLDPNWDISQVDNMTSAEIFDPGINNSAGYTTPAEIAGGILFNHNDDLVVQLKNLSSSQLNSTLYNDWGYAGQSAQCHAITGGDTTGTTGAGWGGEWLLGSGPTAGMAYFNTNNKDPFASPCEPGPDLWSASLLALNVTTGAWMWGFQANAHDPWDYDCSWWQAMGNETISGVNTPVILKSCKNGYLYELNAVTGNLIWAWDPPSTVVPRCSLCYMFDPLNATQMTFAFPTQLLAGQGTVVPGKSAVLTYPSVLGGFEDEQAFDPSLNYVFAAAQDVPAFDAYVGLNSSTYFNSIGEGITPSNPDTCSSLFCSAENNATIFAINASSGAIAWKYLIPDQGYRGGMTVSGGLVYAGTSSGSLYILNARTGALVKNYYIGGPLNVLPSVGATLTGQEELVLFTGAPAGAVSWGATVPGDLFALTLTNVPPPSTGTTSATTTATTTTVTVPGAPGSITTVTVLGAPGSTVTATATTTVVSVSSTGANSGALYGALYGVAAVAVVFIIATGYLAMRGRKPST